MEDEINEQEGEDRFYVFADELGFEQILEAKDFEWVEE